MHQPYTLRARHGQLVGGHHRRPHRGASASGAQVANVGRGGTAAAGVRDRGWCSTWRSVFVTCVRSLCCQPQQQTSCSRWPHRPEDGCMSSSDVERSSSSPISVLETKGVACRVSCVNQEARRQQVRAPYVTYHFVHGSKSSSRI